MANNTKIRGITIELGGDTSGLSKALKNVNGVINDTQAQLKDVERLLKLDPKNTELLAQKQKLLGDQISNTKGKLDSLKQAQETMDQNKVDKNSSQYMALQREIISTETDLKNLEKASKNVSKSMDGVARAGEKIATAAGKVADKTRKISSAAAVALAAVGGMIYKSAKSADELNTLAKQTGFTVEELQRFQYASDLVDVSMDDITGAASKLKKAVAGNNKELAALGIETKNADGSYRNINEVFYDTLAALGNIENEQERDAAAMAIFGKSADQLAGIIDDGGAALKAYGDEAEALGIVLSEDTVNSLNDVNDRLYKLKAQASGRLSETAAKALEVLEPVLERVLDLVDGLLRKVGELTPEQIKTITVILGIVAAISPLASIISKVGGLISEYPGLISKIGSALKWLRANPIAIIIGAIVLIATKGDCLQEKLQELDDWLQNIFAKDWTEIFGPVLGEVVNGLFEKIQGIWAGIRQTLDGIIDFIRGVFTLDWERAWLGIEEIFSGIAQSLVSIFKAPLNGIISLINDALGWINTLIDKVNKIPGVNIGHIGDIPMLASGGVLTQGAAIVGENGPELLSVANGKATVQPLADNAPQATGPVYITVQSVLDGRVIAESTTKYQERAARAHA